MRVLMMLAHTQPSSMGVMVMPACSALAPSTDCTNSGTNEMLPNMAMPASVPCAMVTTNKRWRKSGSGRMGSTARRSTYSSAANKAPANASSSQLCALPGSIKPTSSVTSPAVSNAAPA